ncbi:MAG: hypothetical protein A2Z25_23905 [Planctomycetes bacterium RBG_16_55_9]|nr:MAG: hypothetical protein A2Z25_23905 [Planctomycetes bacterium RBG_16_55_9]
MKIALQHVIRLGWLVTSVALIGLVVCHVRNARRIERLEEMNHRLVEQLARADSDPAVSVTDSEQTGQVDEDKLNRPIEVFSWDIAAMKRAGLKDPLTDIISDLKRRRDLIPYEGTMGGTMNFYGRSKMWILTSKWAIAYFEDGHNGGYLLLEYEIAKGGRIRWKTLASYLS